ncbi:YbaB/EbfC family nucleoid-associated protein [Nocardia tengchongensis]|uniref:YbaB/EbfC family nucleoid-associated protein n=1 Tax=Nocardia tengchongensis TaxID=2055889 RepID=UPI0036B65F31
MSDIHPDVQAALDAARDLRHRIAELRDRINAIHARRPSPSGAVVPEIDAMGRLTDLYLAPGTVDRFDSDQLAAEIMAAIRESTADAGRQYRQLMDSDPWPVTEPAVGGAA